MDSQEVTFGDRLWSAKLDSGLLAQLFGNEGKLSHRHHVIPDGRGKPRIVIETQLHDSR